MNTLQQKYFLKTATLIAVVLVCVFGVLFCVKAQTATFNWDQIYGQTYPGVPPFSQGNLDGSFYGDKATADKVCQLKGFSNSSSFTPGSYYSCGDNFVIQWNGSSFAQVNSCSANTYIQTLTCESAPVPTTLHLVSSSAPATVYLGDSFQIKCNFGANNIPCIAPSSGASNNCSFASFQGNDAIFNCTANTTLGLQKNYCNLFSWPQNAQCAVSAPQTNQIQSTNVIDRCTSHSTKQCSGNAVYWYNSCGTQEDLYQQCTQNQTCQNAQCINLNITCSSNSQCGTNAYTGSPFCQNGNVYQNFITYTCNNPGTAASSCSNSTNAQLKNTCTGNQTCNNGSCTNQNITCSTNAQCGTSALTGSPFCQNSNVYQNFITYTCNNPGTPSSSCSNSTAAQLQNTCTGNQTCNNGSCTNQTIACSTNAQCGTNALVGSPFCQSSNVYQNFITYTCNNPGTPSSSCSNSTAAQLQNTCNSNQTCQNGACVTNQSNLTISCYATPNPVNANQSVTFISNVSGGTGNYTYSWSGACSGSSSTCANSFSNSGTQTATINVTSGSQSNNATCSVGVNQNCTQNSYQRCSGNYLYWYDSCGNQGSGQYCPNGCSNNSCQNNNNYVTVQTNSATNISNNQATLNGYLYNSNNNNNNNCNSYVWFQWGPTASYGTETTHQQQNYVGNFSQIVNLYNNNNYNNSYHFRAVAQDCSGNTVYGQDMTVSAGSNGNLLTVTKTARNMTSGNSGFASTIYANPSDTLMFMITIQATGNQDVQNAFVRDLFPANLIYRNQLVISGSNNYNNNYSGDITSGLNFGTIPAGQTITITYQAQVASAGNFVYGTTTLNNGVSVTSSGSGYNPVSNASVIVTRTAVYGASTVSTGLTNNFWVDSFLLPLLLTLIILWMWKSGLFFGIEKWMDNKKKLRKGYKAEKELANRIAQIQKLERA